VEIRSSPVGHVSGLRGVCNRVTPLDIAARHREYCGRWGVGYRKRRGRCGLGDITGDVAGVGRVVAPAT
jgi:hypothetical protein